LLNHILGGNALFSRLGEQVRQQQGLVYSIDTDLDMKRGTHLISGTLATKNATADEAMAEVKAVLRSLYEKGVTTEECADAKSYVIGAFTRQLDSSSSLSNLLLAMQVHGLGEHYITERASLFKKVSCGDVNALAAKLLNPANFLFVAVGGAADAPASAPMTPAATGHSDMK
jgi:zinc protease